ncbi:MAG: glycosyltransferase [Bacteroidota bacterium]
MASAPRVLFAYVGDPSASSRALRQLRALVALEVEVRVVGIGALSDADALPTPLAVDMLPRPSGRGPAWFWAAHRAVNQHVRRQPADLYLASDLYVLPALSAAAARHGGTLVFDSRELYAHLDASANRPLVRATWRTVERRFIRSADAVLTVSDSIADALVTAYGIPRPEVLPNCPDTPSPGPSDRLQTELAIPDDDRTLVLYQGLFREGRGLLTLLDAARDVDSVRLAFIGEGPLYPEVYRRAQPLGDRAILHPFVPPADLPSFTVGADMGACLIEPLTESLRLSLPNKLFDYLNAHVPVLASPLPEIQRVVDAFEVGTLVDPANPEAVADALRGCTEAPLRSSWRSRIPDALTALAPADVTAHFQRLVLSLLSTP